MSCEAHFIQVGLFIDILYGKRSVVLGREYRIYSPFRCEQQETFLAALQEIRFETGDPTGQSTASNGKDNATGVSRALKLASLLCETFSNKPTVEVVLDDDEAHSAKRISVVCSMKRTSLIEPLKTWMKTHNNMPVTFHDSFRECAMSLSACTYYFWALAYEIGVGFF